MEEPVNPYDPPKSVQYPDMVEGGQVSGRFIVVGRIVELPKYCFLTGAKVTWEKRRAKKLQFVDPNWALLIFIPVIGIIIYAITCHINRKITLVRYSLSDAGRKKLFNRRLFWVSMSVMLLGSSIWAFNYGNEEKVGYFYSCAFGAFIAFLIACYRGAVMRVKKYKDGRFYIAGSGKRFRDLLQKQQPRTRL
ncbi:MAG: hypothetical protein ACSHX6_07525 [Akkermansiaceae bacterium]